MHYSALKAAIRVEVLLVLHMLWRWTVSSLCGMAGCSIVRGYASAQVCMVKLRSQGNAGEHMMYSCSSKCQHP